LVKPGADQESVEGIFEEEEERADVEERAARDEAVSREEQVQNLAHGCIIIKTESSGNTETNYRTPTLPVRRGD
jgi:hypothetical protein